MKRSNVKRHSCLFTCMTTKAIHLELSRDLLASSFINVLRRFLARRGLVKQIYLDNGTNFVGSKRILNNSFIEDQSPKVSNYLRQQGVVWSFNPPGASHMGGVWKRMIQSVKKILIAGTPTAFSTDDNWQTLLVEVESIVKSRPLTNVILEARSGVTPSTPNHLIRLNPSFGTPFNCHS